MKRENSQWFCWQFLGRRFYNESKLLIIKDFRFIICQFFCRSKFLECPNFFRLTAKKKRKSMCKHYIFLLCTVQHVTIVYLFTDRVSYCSERRIFSPRTYVIVHPHWITSNSTHMLLLNIKKTKLIIVCIDFQRSGSTNITYIILHHYWSICHSPWL
jgi:hypothetical protein